MRIVERLRRGTFLDMAEEDKIVAVHAYYKATKTGVIAGLKVLCIINEPTAAAAPSPTDR